MIKTNRIAAFGLLGALTCGVFAPLASAQTAKPKHSFLHKHHKAAGAVAGVGAYKMAKHSKHGIAHRHPFLTGAAAAAATNHVAKKHN